MKQLFPPDFLWGASTAAHQVEGGNHNQWSEWEKANAKRLAETAEERYNWLPSWPDVKQAASTEENYISGNGVDHYHLYKQDFKLLKQLNMNAFRFGIEWARLEPEEGRWDEAAAEHYRQYIAELKRLGIEPILTLWHWTLPVWFADKGGFEKRQNLRYFEQFVAKVAQEYGKQISYLLTLNEPANYVYFGYIRPDWPPQRRNPLLGWRVYWHLAQAHKHAYRIWKEASPSTQIGIPAILGDLQPLRPQGRFNRMSIRFGTYLSNWWFLNRIRKHLDFIGVNYYFTEYRDSFARLQNPRRPLSDLGWYMEPSGLERLLMTVWKRYHLPLLITENGLADDHDTKRQWWLEQTITALRGALAKGVDVRGYLHWSLLDNFEWAYGWWPHFGLIAVDRRTMRRTVRPSAKWFAQQIKALRDQ